MIKTYETEEDCDFENRIFKTSFNEISTEQIETKNLSIKDLNFPEQIQKKLLGCINYSQSRSVTFPNILLIGCPDKYITRLLDAIANEMNVQHKAIGDCNIKQGDLAKVLTNLSDGDIISIKHIESINSSVLSVLEQAIIDYQLNIVLGRGQSARNILIDLPSFCTILSVDNINQVPKTILDSFYEIIDFKKYDHELRAMEIYDFAKKYDLHFESSVIEHLARQFTDEDQLKIKLFDLRNQAFESNILDISESFLQCETHALPDIDEINSMDGREFELFTGNLFKALGYSNVSVTQSSCDFGADVIAEKDDVKFAIQCKRYASPVGVSAVQEVIASKSLHDCHVACILTNNTFTPAAEELARKNLVILWGGNKLKEFIDKTKGK